MGYDIKVIDDNNQEIDFKITKDTDIINFKILIRKSRLFIWRVLVNLNDACKIEDIETIIETVSCFLIEQNKLPNVLYLRDCIVKAYNIRTTRCEWYDMKEDEFLFKLAYLNSIVRDKELLKYTLVHQLSTRFPSIRFDRGGNFYVFHAGYSPKPLREVNFGYHGSECGNYGFFCGFTPGLVLNHRNCGCSYISCYLVNFDKLLDLATNICIEGYIDEFDIIFSYGSSFCSRYGGQVVFRNSNAVSCLEYLGGYHRSDFRNDILGGKYVNCLNNYIEENKDIIEAYLEKIK